jgi:hypothetical protein
MGFRDYSPGLNRFLTRDMYNGALADMNLGSNPWTMSRYTYAGGNPTTLIEYDGHMPVIDNGGAGFSDSTAAALAAAPGTPAYVGAGRDLRNLSPEVGALGISYARYYGVPEELVIALLMQERPFYAGAPDLFQEVAEEALQEAGERGYGSGGDVSVGMVQMKAPTANRILLDTGYAGYEGYDIYYLRSEISNNDEFAVALAVLHLKLDLSSGMTEKEAYLSYALSPDEAVRLADPNSGLVQNSSVLSERSRRYEANMFAFSRAADFEDLFGVEIPVPRFGVRGGICPRQSCTFSDPRPAVRWLDGTN